MHAVLCDDEICGLLAVWLSLYLLYGELWTSIEQLSTLLCERNSCHPVYLYTYNINRHFKDALFHVSETQSFWPLHVLHAYEWHNGRPGSRAAPTNDTQNTASLIRHWNCMMMFFMLFWVCQQFDCIRCSLHAMLTSVLSTIYGARASRITFTISNGESVKPIHIHTHTQKATHTFHGFTFVRETVVSVCG